MDIEVMIGIIAVFVSGGAVGVGATLFSQWTHRKLTWPLPHQQQIDSPDTVALKGEVEDLTRAVLSLNERVEFQERLISRDSVKGKTDHETGLSGSQA